MTDRKKLEEIIAGCEGVTPGPWDIDEGNEARPPMIVARDIDADDRGRAVHYKTEIATVADTMDDEANAAHIARLDPQTVKAMAERIIALEDAAKEAAKALDALSLGRSIHNDRFPSQRIDGGVWTAASAALKRLLALEKETHDAE